MHMLHTEQGLTTEIISNNNNNNNNRLSDPDIQKEEFIN
jgi:hypothetical protein